MTARTRPIGGALAGGLTIRGLSGGERKRLALACAVAMRPSILFLDEITRYVSSVIGGRDSLFSLKNLNT